MHPIITRVLAALSVPGFAALTFAQAYSLTPIATSQTPIPGGSGTFFSTGIPVFDGRRATFSDGGVFCFSATGLWSWNATNGVQAVTRGFVTPRPLGSGTRFLAAAISARVSASERSPRIMLADLPPSPS
jgi:hypothetical protein